MAHPKLVIRKRMQFIQGKTRACCFVQLMVEPNLQAQLEEYFINEALFRRAAYSAAWPSGALTIPAALSPHLSSFLKNDACPEITVRSLLGGQMYQGATTWEMMCFEFVAKLAFENFLGMAKTIGELSQDVVYSGEAAVDVEAFEADTKSERRTLGDEDLAA
jgi:hypothetical protein